MSGGSWIGTIFRGRDDSACGSVFFAPSLLLLLAGATLGEGGATPTALLGVHAAVLVLALCALLGSRVASAGPAMIPAPGPLGAFLVFLALAVAGAAWAPYAYGAWLVILEPIVFLVVGILAAASGPELASRISSWMIWPAAVQGILAVAQRVAAGEARPAGTFLNPNHLAAWLVAVLVLGAGAEGWGRRPFAFLRWVAAAAGVAGLFVTGSRGALLGLLAAAAIFVPALLRGASGRRRFRLLAGIATVAAVAAVGVALRFRATDPFAFHRLQIWRSSFDAAAGSLLGTGPGQFAVAAANLNFPLDGAPLRFERSFVSPHSDLLRVPCEFGWPAAAALLVALVLAAVEIGRRSGSARPATRAAVAALVALAAQATVDDLTDRPAIYLLAAALLGSLLSTKQTRAGRLGVLARGAVAVSASLAFLVGDVAPYLSWRAVRGLPRGRLSASEAERLDAATRFNPIHPGLWLRRSEHLAEDPLWGLQGYALARECAERAVRLQPQDATYRRGLARIEARACVRLFRDVATRRRASEGFSQAEARARHDPFLPIEHGEFLLATGDPAGARGAAERALAIEPEAIPARLLLAAAILEVDGADGVPRARTVLAEARSVAARLAAVKRETPYAESLLRFDEARAARIETRMRGEGAQGLPTGK